MFQGVGRGAGTGVRVLTAGLPGKGGASEPQHRASRQRRAGGQTVGHLQKHEPL